MYRFLFFSFLWLTGFTLTAQTEPCSDQCAVDQIRVSTAYDHLNSTVYPPTSYDPIWTLVEAPDIGISVPRPAYVVAPNPAWAILPNAGWLSAYPIADLPTNNPEPAAPFGFETCFCICQPTEVIIDLNVLADNFVDVYLTDDTGTNILPLGTQGNFLPGSVVNMNASISLDEGTYCLRADLRNFSSVAMGLSIDGTITGAGLVSTLCCRNTGTISGSKYNDLDCDGIRDRPNNINAPGHDPGLPNWGIILCDAMNTPVDTAYTDSFGFYNFTGVSPGNYFVKEINQSGWTPSQPATGQYSITVDTLGVISNVDFGNCETPCGQVVRDSISLDCADQNGYVYNFQIENLSGYDVSSVVINSLPPGYTFSTQYWSSNGNPSLPILNTQTSGWLEVIIYPSSPITQPTEICFNVVLLSGDFACCHFEHCLTLLPLDPCGATGIVSSSVDTSEGCCYDLKLTNDFCPDFFVGVGAEIITPGVVFSQYGTSSAATITANTNLTALTYTPVSGYIALGAFDMSICLDGIVNVNQMPQLIAFNWYAVNAAGESYIACTDTLEFFCEPCLLVSEESISCNENGTASFTFTVTNNTMPAQTSTQIVLEVHTPGVVFTPAVINTTLLSGQSTTITVTVSGANSGDLILYKVLLLDEDGWCCHLDGLSVTMPDCTNVGCDCGEYEEFINDALLGFALDDSDCPVISLTPLQQDPCNRTRAVVRFNGDSKELSLDAAGQYLFEVPNNGSYEFCMSIQRFNDAGEPCFPNEEPVTICKAILVECVSLQINPDIEDQPTIYPNPVSEQLVVKLARDGSYLLRIVDSKGQIRLQRKQKTKGNSITLQVDQLTDGIYWLILTDEKGNTYQKRFIKL